MLEVRNLTVSYGRHRALDAVNLRVEKGEICVILGANGAGKSSLLKTIAGMVKAENGEVVMNGKPITAMPAHEIVDEGIALVPEGRGIFGDLTVVENLKLGAFSHRARSHEAETLATIYRLFPRLAERKEQIARTMSGGEQQMVAIGRALMSRPDILMLDEPSLGLSPILTLDLFRSLGEIAKSGVGILLVEQNARQSLKIASRGYLIENARVTGENSASAMMTDPAVINAYLGGQHRTEKPAQTQQPAIRLPAQQRMPNGLEAMSRMINELARRAGRIHVAFIRSLRREASVPSAFVGKYDPAASPDPWEEQAAKSTKPPQISDDARKISLLAGSMAEKAGNRLALHILSLRDAAPRPSAFANKHSPETNEAENSLIGHNSRYAEEDEQREQAEVRILVTEPAVENGTWPVSDGIQALILQRMDQQKVKQQPQQQSAWPISDGISALIAKAAERQSLGISHQGGGRLTQITVDGAAAAEANGTWPISQGIAGLIAANRPKPTE